MTSRSGRPRVVGDRAQEILDAAADTLIEVGYDKFSFDLVAAQASVGKATLYRRWPTKAALAMAAVTNDRVCALETFPAASTGSLVDDFTALADSRSGAFGRIPTMLMAIAPALHRDEALTAAFQEEFLGPRQARIVGYLQAAQQRGEIGPNADLLMLASILPGLAITRVLATGLPPSAGELAAIVRGVLVPACAATRVV